MKQPLVSIIIVNFNGLKHLQTCLSSLKKITYNGTEIIIVDNGSTDGSLEFIRKFSPPIKVVENQTNNGFALANNQGAKIAHGKYLLLLNNDTKVEPDFLEPLVAALSNDRKLAAVQSKIYLMGQGKKLDSTGAFLTRTGFLKHEGLLEIDKGQYDNPREIFSAKGACVLIKRQVINQVGLFDSDFFAYFEETDFFWRCWLRGYIVKFIPDSVIHHAMGATSSRLRSEFVEYHSFKNRIASLYKNLGAFSLFYILTSHIILTIGVGSLFIFTGQGKRGLGVFKAIGWSIKNFNNNSRKRKVVQRKLRKIADKSLFPEIMRGESFKSRWRKLIGYFGIKRQ